MSVSTVTTLTESRDSTMSVSTVTTLTRVYTDSTMSVSTVTSSCKDMSASDEFLSPPPFLDFSEFDGSSISSGQWIETNFQTRQI
ncbi:hypothetical protein PoB_006277100 [Plakobranchus ocellatus]|uniref:Uncharacterized protein n=1 Tax=Plakobranchus ocellatus TaxID=259542 RepID=A0AAV4CWI7_9GAST|nr:hypothetical protein PoB_006277100 [Plakobranchus ocellatus]